MAKAFQEFCILACSLFLLPLPVFSQELAAGTALEVRLTGATGSHISHRGDPIEATVIAPVSVDGRIVVPQGSRLLGSIANATALGLGLKHSTAALAYAFHTLRLPNGEAIQLKTQLIEVDTAKESVDDLGTVHGIHPIVSLASGLSYFAVPLLLVDPTVGIPVWGVKSLIAPSANPEIYFPTGTEVILRLTTAATVPAPNVDLLPTKPLLQRDLIKVTRVLKDSEQKAHMGSRTSDIVNVLLMGSEDQINHAFHASGWAQAQRKSPMSLYRMYHALTKRHGYPRAPMNGLTLNGVPSAFVHQKSLDTVQKRHHVRFWQYPREENIWLGAAAEDIGFRFQLMHWTHSTDPHIDRERAKVVNDLAFTGCVDAAALLPRDSADIAQDPKAQYPIVTDGSIAVVRLNGCDHSTLMAGVSETSALPQRSRVARALVGFRDDLLRSNVVFTTYNTLKLLTGNKAKPRTAYSRMPGSEPRELDWLASGSH